MNRTRRTFIPILLLAFAITQLGLASDARAQEKTQASPEKIHLYLLVGQSNMAGRGRVAKQDKEPHPRILMLDKKLLWRKAVAPLHFDKPAVVGVGVGRTFAMEMLKTTPAEVTIGLIPAAAGGSPIDSWKPGGYHSQTKSHPYDDAIRRARHAMKTGELKGILWHQGESDSKPKLAEDYAAKLDDLVKRLRSDLKAPHVPFVAGQMGQFSKRPGSDAKRKVDLAHRDLPSRVPNCGFVGSEGLKHKGDQVHFNADSYRQFGRRYAKTMQELRKPKTDK